MELLHWLTQLDDRLLLFVNGMHSPYWDCFMKLYSGKLIWVPMYVAIFWVMAKNLHWKTLLVCVAALALTIVFADQVGATLIRPQVERLRPANLENPISAFVHIVDGYRGGRYGFPSCHAANTFGLAFFLCFLFRNRGLAAFMLGWAALTCYSRMYLGVHYLGDLLAGMLIGLLGAWIMYRIFAKVTRHRWEEKPKLLQLPVLAGLLTMAGILLYAALQ